MSGIFIVPAANAAAAQNLCVSVWNALQREAVERVAPPAIAKADVAQHGIYAWGISPGEVNFRNWSLMREGDWVLFFAHKHFIGVARLTFKARLPEFARALWGDSKDGRTWELTCFLSPPVRIFVPAERLTEFIDDRYQAFTRIDPGRLTQICGRFGSADEFVESQLLAAEAGIQIAIEDIRAAVDAYNSGEGSEFGPSVVHELMIDGRAYPPKPIYALAYRRTLGRELVPGEVSSGEGSPCFCALRSLGLEIRRRPPLQGMGQLASRKGGQVLGAPACA